MVGSSKALTAILRSIGFPIKAVGSTEVLLKEGDE